MHYRQALAQALTKLMSPEDILAHSCGEYVLDQLQRGVSPDKVADVLLQEYLVVVDSMRLRAYRRLREQLGDYWTLEHLELHHWEYLYQQMPVEADGGAGAMRSHHQKLRGIHSRFCEHADIAEELVPMRVFHTFLYEAWSTGSFAASVSWCGPGQGCAGGRAGRGVLFSPAWPHAARTGFAVYGTTAARHGAAGCSYNINRVTCTKNYLEI